MEDHERYPVMIAIDPKVHGFVMRRRMETGEALTNVPRNVVHHSPDGFEWGYGGSGPADLALNILEYVITREGLARGGVVQVWRGSCSRRAWELHQDFKWAFISPADKEGATIPYQTVRAWIENQPFDAYD